MKTFHCDACGALVFFENVSCLQCGHSLGYLPDVMDLTALEPAQDDLWTSLSTAAPGRLYRPCANGRAFGVCNWYVPAEDGNPQCLACRLNAEVPEIYSAQDRLLWQKLESAKRRLIYTLRRLELSIDGGPSNSWPRLQFRFLAETPWTMPVLTGHDSGVITISLAEADDVEREKRRAQFCESQRTLLGHFRHESGHYYWGALIANSKWLDEFRALFGDERCNYREALNYYYANGPGENWPSVCVSAYASAHPWEDWAETWAHFLQMVDSLETAADFGLSVRPRHPTAKSISADPRQALAAGNFDTMIERWLPLTYALNSLNRSIGVPDAYPYVLSSRALEKLRFIHEVVTGKPNFNDGRPPEPLPCHQNPPPPTRFVR